MRKAPGMAVTVRTAMLGALCGDGELQAKEHFDASQALQELDMTESVETWKGKCKS